MKTDKIYDCQGKKFKKWVGFNTLNKEKFEQKGKTPRWERKNYFAGTLIELSLNVCLHVGWVRAG